MTTICSLVVIAASLLLVQFISFSTAGVCDQPKDPGPCEVYIPSYYYDQEAKTCKDFVYGGCQGNENNFLTKEECDRTCNPVCDQPPDTGPCKMHIDRYYYDQEAKTCKDFVYGGCQGNGNNFHTREECDRTCNPVCDQPLDPGTCIVHTGGQNRMPIPRYYYKKETGTCEQFFTDICGGNENNFATQEECETSCKPDILCDPPPFFPTDESISPFYQEWYYDEWLKSCMKFNKRKCRGFGKRFDTKEDCERTCKSDCDQLLNPDPDKAHVERYYYDKNTRTCKSFMYGNCGGNDNNFATKEKCETQCKPAKRT
ncbi:carboxypeptidase inhibitor SmCI-like isoform X1 [Lithobates pipiens]